MKKDRHDGRPIIYNNVEKQRGGTEAEDVGVDLPALFYYNFFVKSEPVLRISSYLCRRCRYKKTKPTSLTCVRD